MTEEEIFKLATEVSKLLAKEVYGDALKPGMTEIGKAIQTVLGLGNTVLTSIAMVNDKVKHIREKNLLKLDAKLKRIESEKIVDIHPEIAVPVLRKLEYTQNKEIADLFLNLLTTAANFDTAHLAHPSFVNIISNISPDEAKILKYIQVNRPLCHVNIRSNNKDGTFSSFCLGTTVLEIDSIIDFKSNSTIYISNLLGLGLLGDFACPSGNAQVQKIKTFLNDELQKIQSLEKVDTTQFQFGSYDLTKYGELFLDCCSKKDEL